MPVNVAPAYGFLMVGLYPAWVFECGLTIKGWNEQFGSERFQFSVTECFSDQNGSGQKAYRKLLAEMRDRIYDAEVAKAGRGKNDERYIYG